MNSELIEIVSEVLSEKDDAGESDGTNGDDLECFDWDIAQAVVKLRENLPKSYKIFPGHDQFSLDALKDHSTPLIIKPISSEKGGGGEEKKGEVQKIEIDCLLHGSLYLPR